jgi:hypothetical protein
MYRIIEAQAQEGYKIKVKFVDGAQGVVDFSYLAGRGVFALWNDYTKFKNVTIGSSGELLWGDTVDICPDTIYMKITGKKPEDIFPGIKREPYHA